MTYRQKICNRKSIRLKNYNYAKEGMYFITICTKNREKILSKIIISNVGVDAYIDPKTQLHENKNDNVTIQLKHEGKIVNKYIQNINNVYSNINVNICVIMPNHIHNYMYKIRVDVGIDPYKRKNKYS